MGLAGDAKLKCGTDPLPDDTRPRSDTTLASLSQSLHQLGQFHDGPTRKQAWMNGDAHAGRAASYRESWELHRAGEMIHQVAECVDRAHEIEATIAYDIHDYPSLAPVQRSSSQPGMSL